MYNVDFFPAGACLMLQAPGGGAASSAVLARGSELSRTVQNRFVDLSRQQQDAATELKQYISSKKVVSGSIGIVEIRKEHQKRIAVLKAHPFITP
jgi:hypothetical protein